MRYRHVLFDLDGTLTEPALGITNSIQYALKKLGREVPERTALYPCIGPSLAYSFHTFFGLDETQTQQAIAYYREYFSVTGLFENAVYPGIPELLDQLQRRGQRIYLASSKPQEFSLRILKHFSLADQFTCIAGNTLSNARPEKADVIRYLLDTFPDMTPENTIMVGDRRYDVEGAAQVGLSCIGVLFGYGSPTELETAGATRLAKTVTQLGQFLAQ